MLGYVKKKVLHVVTALDFGGVESHMVMIQNEAASASYEHFFLIIARGGAASLKIQENGGRVDELKLNPAIPSLDVFIALYRYMKIARPDVVHTHGAEANFHGLPSSWLAGVRTRIGEEIGIPSHGYKARLFFRFSYLFAGKVIAISSAVKKWLLDSKEVPAGKCLRLYNPVALPEPRACNDCPEKIFRIGFVGRLEPVKNPLGLLDAFSCLIDSGVDAELWFIGDGSQRKLLEQKVKESGLEKRVTLYGFQDNPSGFIRQCSIYVQPSLSEGFGLALVEAMGCEVPVIATAVGGAPEILQHGMTGWLVERPDVASISAALLHAAKLPPETLITMGKAARRSIETRFEPRVYLQQLEAIYTAELAGK